MKLYLAFTKLKYIFCPYDSATVFWYARRARLSVLLWNNSGQKSVTSCEEYFTYVSAHGEKTPAIL